MSTLRRSPWFTWNETALDLRSRPGKWEIVAHNLKEGNESYPFQRLRKLGCEVRLVQENKRVTIHARWPIGGAR